MDRLPDFIVKALEWTESHWLWGVLLFVVTFTLSLAVVALVLVKLPATYFCDDHHPAAFAWADRHPALRGMVWLGKNLLGLVLVVVGIILSLPGVPGQGVLTILIGVTLLDFPGKRRMERKLVSRPRVLRAVNRLRARFGKPPLVVQEAPPSRNKEPGGFQT